MDTAEVRLVTVEQHDGAGFRMQVEVKTGVDLHGKDVWKPIPTAAFDDSGFTIRVKTGAGRQPIAIVPISLLQFKSVELGKIEHGDD